jgi:glycosyltransferase involved in cell wall biosynthesis
MRILIFHGYLLRGTGSNVYNSGLAAALRAAGHEVHLLAQERRPEELEFVDAVGTWGDSGLHVETLREPVRCTVYRPDIGGLLPVYVADRYEGLEARTYPELSDEELAEYLEANVAAVHEVAARARPDVALANHLIMGPAIVARALGGEVPFAVKVHGSALEYTVKPHPERFMPYAREGLDAANGVLVGSRHTAESLWAAMDDPGLPERTRLGPPGVDIELFRPRDEADAVAGVERLAARLEERAADAADAPRHEDSAFSIDAGEAARAVAELDPAHDRLVIFIGKLIVSKGIDLLLAAWTLVLAREPRARLVVVGFGAWREAAERLVAALAAGDREAALEIAREGRGAEGGPEEPLRHLTAFLERWDGTPQADLAERVVFTGRLEHEDLRDLLPACEALVFPSTFPEAYGMVAAEAAACGVYPVSANHSGLAEVSRALEAAVPPEAASGLRFDVSDRAVEDLAACVTGWLEAPAELRARTRAALAETAEEHFSWAGVARRVVAAAEGRLGDLPRVPSDRIPRP